MNMDSTMVEVSFLPHFHTMGLIASYLQTLYTGGTGYFMSPLAFDQNPGLWIQALSKFKGTHSKVPNFALEHVLREGFPKDTHLYSVRFIMNASEYVQAETNLCFEAAFLPYGLKRGSIQAGYGFMEHMLYVCVSQEEDPLIINNWISCGKPKEGVTVKVVEDEQEAEDGNEGEIWVCSDLNAHGYWRREAETEETFHATLISEDFESVYVRTGVWGFTTNGHLFLCSRISDFVKLSDGRIILPGDIESRVEVEMTALRAGGSVAFNYDYVSSKDTNAEARMSVSPKPQGESAVQSCGNVGYVAEVRSPDQYTPTELQSLAEKIATIIMLEFEAKVAVTAFIRPSALPRTWSTSSHCRRVLAKKQLKNDSLNEIYRWTSQTNGKAEGKDAQTKSENTTCPASSANLPSVTTTKSSPSSSITITVEQGDLEPLASDTRGNTDTHNSMDKRLRSPFPLKEDNGTLNPKSKKRIKVKRASSTSPRKRLLETTAARRCSEGGNEINASITNVEWLTKTIGKVLGVTLQSDSNIWASGCTSLMAVQISQRLQREFGFAVKPHVLFTHQTPRAILGKLQTSLLGVTSPEKVTSTGHETGNGIPSQASKSASSCKDTGIAIVGMACSFASCKDTTELWEMMLRKETVMTRVQLPYSDKTIFGAFTETVGLFDYKFFGISKWEASTIDPQQSILLHVAWECLQNAGYGSGSSLEAIKGTDIGVFIGATSSDARVLGQSREPLPPGTSFVGAITANRISYFFDFKGPSVTVDTACGASLSALHSACSSLKLGECSAALVGGVNAMLDPNGFLFLANMGMLSPDGKGRVFDAGANGYLRGEGCGVVLLKRVADAERDGDKILAVVKSVVTNHNGTSATPTSPNCLSQQSLLSQSLRAARLTPADICYVEAHGSGTKLGDPIEIDAIVETFCQQYKEHSKDDAGTKSRPILVGSVKANIGHLEQGAGIAGLIKTVMVLEHARAPGNACLEALNPAFTLDASQISIPKDDVSLEGYISRCDREEEDGRTRQRLLAGAVNSFGFGGTNVNAILQQYTILPHLGRTKLGVMLDRGSLRHEGKASKLLLETIEFLCLKLEAFGEAYCRCMKALDRVVAKLKGFDRAFLLQSQDVLSFSLLYGMAEMIRAQGVEINFAGGTDVCAELVTLVLTDTLILTDAFRLLLMGLDPQRFNLASSASGSGKSFLTAIPFYSSSTGEVYKPSEIPEDYMSRLMSAIGCMESQGSSTNECREVAFSTLSGYKPLLWISLIVDDSIPGDSSIVIQLCKNRFLMQEIREKLLEARNENDTMALEMCPSRPSRGTPMPKFYDRYPLRAVMDGVRLTPPHANTTLSLPEDYDGHSLSSNAGSSTMHNLLTRQQAYNRSSIDSVTSYDSDAGYITQTASGESLEPPTPLDSPTITAETPAVSNGHGDPSRWMQASVMETVLKKRIYKPPEDALVSPGELKKLVEKLLEGKEDEEDTEVIVRRPTAKAKVDTLSPIYKEMKVTVLRELHEEIKEDLDDPELPPGEMSTSGIFQLGLDSLSVMQIASFIKMTYDVNKSFSELVDCETMGRIAETVLRKSPTFSGKLPFLEEEQDARYPTLTKEGYYTIPSLARLRTLPAEHLKHVENFTIARKAKGKVMFLGKTDITALNFNTLVDIEPLYVEVRSHPDQPQSSNLNRPALIFFENVCPREETEEGYATMLAALKEACRSQEMGAEIVEYNGPSGKVVMKVDHFH